MQIVPCGVHLLRDVFGPGVVRVQELEGRVEADTVLGPEIIVRVRVLSRVGPPALGPKAVL